MFKVLTGIGVQLILAGVALGLTPVSTLIVSCGSPFRELNPPSTGEKFFKELRADCVDRRDGRQDIAMILLIVGGAGFFGGAMGVITDRNRKRTDAPVGAAVGD